MKTTILFTALFLFLIYNDAVVSQPQKRLREITVKEEINQYFQNYYSGMYEVGDIVDIDSLRGNKKYLYASIQNPYGMLTNSFVFVTEVSDNYQGEVEGDRVGIYKDGNMVWLSDPDLSTDFKSIFAIDDINLNGTVEIITQSGTGTVSLDIYSWNGTTGNLISGEGILGAEYAMDFVDVEGDGILEITNLNYYDGSEVWSWNGSEYGQWTNTPIAPPTELYPANNFIPHVSCLITKQGNSFTYSYAVENDAQSKQRIELFWVVADVVEEDLTKEAPPYWESSGYSNNLEGWQTPVLNNGYLIWPGESKGGFKFVTHGLPVISTFAMQANNALPDYDSLTQQESIEILLNDLSENMVWGETVGPREPDDTLNFQAFLDTLIDFNQRSFELDWIATQIITNQYDSLFNRAKTLLQGNHIPWVDSTLQTVLNEVDEDSISNLTSEAYALLKYNTEYLLENLPEVIPPVLNLISPSITFPYVKDVPDGPFFEVTVSGQYFTDSSDIFFNGQKKSINFLSDSILTFQINFSDVDSIGIFPVWISNYGSNSDTLDFSVLNNLPQSIVPILECIVNNGNNSYTAFFGYHNYNDETVFIPFGAQNKFSPGQPSYVGQPQIFLPGLHNNVFTVDFTGNESITWTLDGENVIANKRSQICP